jgi:O-acetyl-ADP-ribose deacetylase (regulator of RNase III)
MPFIEVANITQTGADIEVNTVNCVGVMGAGLAKFYKEHYPDMFQLYRRDCKAGKYKPGDVVIYAVCGRYIANAATKRHWKYPSQKEWVVKALQTLRERSDKAFQLKLASSISIPPMGCGLGGLDYGEIKQEIIKIFQDSPLTVYLLR